ncbi:CBO0543 family protein [Neobacillus endophyticus]|uniref:CBO0543 family protein n=1 Tax=Neobacillus endophyticus TaxID=2738405 RepID=UPI001C256EA4|nr:CBO0543 family protein [Neobacillus endophyticus]
MYKGLNLINQGYETRFKIWQEEVLFSWRWWFGMCLSILSWIIWFLIRRGNSSDRLFYSGLFIMFVSVSFDAIGMQLKAWHYIYPMFPVLPAYLPFDLCIMPVSIMILIQVKPQIKPTYKGVIFAFFASFVGEPFFHLLDIYDPIYWKHYYSFPIYFVIYLVADKLTKRNDFTLLS